MVRVDASRRVTFSAETDTAFSLEDAFFVGAVGFGLVFALVAISKCLEEFKDKRMLAARHAFKINHVIVPLPWHCMQSVLGLGEWTFLACLNISLHETVLDSMGRH
jgi:hypothetical protein